MMNRSGRVSIKIIQIEHKKGDERLKLMALGLGYTPTKVYKYGF